MTPFRIDVPESVLDDLMARLANARFTTPSSTTSWGAGTDPDYLRELVSRWGDGFDWRAREEELNRLPQYIVDGVHFVHLRRSGKPLLLCHGWPSSFVEMLPLVDRLADFDLVVPSMPGFLWSALPDGPLTRESMARGLHRLMTETLGYESYGAFGGDIGGAVVGWLGALYPDRITGIHLIHPPFPAIFDPPPTEAEQSYLDAEAQYDQTDDRYSAIMGSRPDTVAAGLQDSPAGLAAWLVDKYRDWSVVPWWRDQPDTLLTMLTLYWVTGCVGTSFRQYLDFPHNRPRPPITVPAGFTVSAEPGLRGFPRQIAERACTDIRSWRLSTRGGHFMPLEAPDDLAAELRAFFG
jgi:pimeloyl-ACP methyl ester carboxylesterase